MSYFNLLRILILGMFISSCSNDDDEIPALNFRQEIRSFVQDISTYAKNQKNYFLIIPQDGQEILTVAVDAIDVVGHEDRS